MFVKNNKVKFYILLVVLLISACTPEIEYDLVLIGDNIYTAAEGDSSDISAIAVVEDRIVAVGDSNSIMQNIHPGARVVRMGDGFIMPGLIEGHGHFSGLGSLLQNLNFLKDTSWAQIMQKVVTKAESMDAGEWVFGRGWHQEKWTITPENGFDGYPMHDELSKLTSKNPVLLIHASGHSLYANEEAMKLAGITPESLDPVGGRIVKNDQGDIVGVFEERAMTPFKETYKEYLDQLDEEEQLALWQEGIDLAQQECLENGITSFQDAGSTFEELDRYEQRAKEGNLDVRLWVMLREKNKDLDDRISSYRKVNLGNYFYTCRAIKSELDGALGAYGAWLLKPYNDKPGFVGQNTTPVSDVESIAKKCFENDMQLCVHAIGDRANKETLDIMASYNEKTPGLRWRVEHAQHLNPNDINRFKETGAIASMQAVHCTSDAPFVVKRLGDMRAKIGAYAWKALLRNGVKIVNGTDVPVEDIDPITNFYSSVTRTRLDNGMTFFVEQRMSREEALRSYTIDAAYGAFEEDLKGSIEVGKLADFTIIDTNWLECSDDEIPDTKVLYTIVGGEIKYENTEALKQ
ncbi:MAG: amidohydrolase [Saprospiraceae bacterium]|nr:amidohydrolase [Saprospiraceae bacterium]